MSCTGPLIQRILLVCGAYIPICFNDKVILKNVKNVSLHYSLKQSSLYVIWIVLLTLKEPL